ncbi:hypothetical protein K501DRAFT_179144 [Backusella circina FSU 941]|nr:hypothetical protein K501DRAFT_179144 [Backusella circina FSU 941]
MASATTTATTATTNSNATPLATTTTFSFSATVTPTDTTSSMDSGYPDNSEAFSNLPTSSSFGNTIYAGVATFDTPKASSSVSPIYPIQSNMNVTFRWQYTALRVRPVNVTLNAVAPNSVTYPISVLDGATSEATWHFSSVPTASPPLMNGYYKIQLYDQRGVKADYKPGWMVPCTTLSIALYTPDLYNTYSTEANYCPTCFYSSANSMFYETIRPLAMMSVVALSTSVLFLFKVLR